MACVGACKYEWWAVPTLIWLTLVKWKKHRPAPAFFDAGFLVVDVFQSTRRGGTVLATVEYSDIRGLVTDMTFLRRGAASGLRTGVKPGWAYPFRVVEDSPIRGCAPAAALE
jgi:hypothetical protein